MSDDARAAQQLLAERADTVRTADERPVPSPCLNVCRMEADSGLCAGCLRTLEEITAWGQMDNEAKRALWRVIEERLARRSSK